MGAHLAQAAYVRWNRLDDRPFRVLIRMALTALDSDDEPTYFGGWEPLALGLGFDVPDAGAPDGPRLRRNAQESVRKAIKVLVDAGAVTRVNTATAGRRARYRVNAQGLSPAVSEGQSSRPREGLSPDAAEGQRSRPREGLSPDVSEGPRRHTGTKQEKTS